MPTLIKSGTLVTADAVFESDLLIDGGKIAQIARKISTEGKKVVDAAGRLVLPGGVDAHVHLDLPMFGTVSSDDHYTGMKAAAFGGTTTVIDFVPQDKPSLKQSIDAWHAKADAKAAVDFAFHMNITRFNDQVAAEFPALEREGITSLKVFTAYNNRLRLGDAEIFKVMRIARDHGFLTLLHAENGDVIDLLVSEAVAAGNLAPIWHARTRPAWSEVEASLRGAALAAMAEAPLYLVHMNVAGEVDMLEYIRAQGLPVMGETCPQYLFFTEAHLERPDGAKWICSPPMRSLDDNLRLWEGLADGTLQTVATDHCPFFYDGTKEVTYEGKQIKIPGKELGQEDFTRIPNGLPGVGDRLLVLFTYGVAAGRLSLTQFVALTATNPAKIFGLYPRKGSLTVGSDADLAIWNIDRHYSNGVKVAKHRTDYNLYEGWELTARPERVFLRGRLIVDGERWLGKPGQGRFLKRKPGAEIL
ncbi:MAG: dihydropyrimidinase [Anaerolineaceae bacterium]|nr:dihydropyrimidinase [Anaerolineaceae bacterium]